jgi:hypothetical protein
VPRAAWLATDYGVTRLEIKLVLAGLAADGLIEPTGDGYTVPR